MGLKGCFCGSSSKKHTEGDHNAANSKQEKLPWKPSLKSQISKLSTASSNRSYYTACDPADTAFSQHSSRFSEDSLAELDAWGAEAEKNRGKKRTESLRRGPELASVNENESTTDRDGHSELHGSSIPDVESVDVAAVSSERASFLSTYDAAVLKSLNTLQGSNSDCVADVPVLAAAPWNKRSGYLGHLTHEQQVALETIRSWFPKSRQWHTDHDILRFLRARDFDLEKTKELYCKYIEQYRGSSLTSPYPVIREAIVPFGMDSYKLFPERDAKLTAEMQKLKDYFLHTLVFNLDKEGRPVVYFKPAHIVKNNMNKYVDLRFRISFQSAANEGILHLMRLASKHVGYHVENCTQILDLGGMSALQMLSHMRSEESQAEWQHNMDFQPEVLHKIYVINAPTGMSAVWKFASFFVPANTRAKVEVCGSNYFSTLEKAIGKENMPSCYGGTQQFDWHEHKSVKDLKHR